jgi:hypothetical protein
VYDREGEQAVCEDQHGEGIVAENFNPFTPAKVPHLVDAFDRMAYHASVTSMMIRSGQFDAAVNQIAALSAAGKEAIRIAKEKE